MQGFAFHRGVLWGLFSPRLPKQDERAIRVRAENLPTSAGLCLVYIPTRLETHSLFQATAQHAMATVDSSSTADHHAICTFVLRNCNHNNSHEPEDNLSS